MKTTTFKNMPNEIKPLKEELHEAIDCILDRTPNVEIELIEQLPPNYYDMTDISPASKRVKRALKIQIEVDVTDMEFTYEGEE